MFHSRLWLLHYLNGLGLLIMKVREYTFILFFIMQHLLSLGPEKPICMNKVKKKCFAEREKLN